MAAPVPGAPAVDPARMTGDAAAFSVESPSPAPRALAPLRAGGDDEALGDVAQAHLLGAQAQRHGQHVVVGAADGLATLSRGLMAFEGAVGMYSRSTPGMPGVER
ncbi:hypothetical protein [Streptomyces syringium]|uniref:hypothetical protein n=1 Tax=Streptomyces syringium TaxID=76729 RepID=UPI0037D51501